MDEPPKIVPEPRQRFRKKKFGSVISLTDGKGTVSKVNLTGPEAEVRYVAAMFSLGMAAQKAGITHETIQVARQHAMGRMSGLIERAT